MQASHWRPLSGNDMSQVAKDCSICLSHHSWQVSPWAFRILLHKNAAEAAKREVAINAPISRLISLFIPFLFVSDLICVLRSTQQNLGSLGITEIVGRSFKKVRKSFATGKLTLKVAAAPHDAARN